MDILSADWDVWNDDPSEWTCGWPVHGDDTNTLDLLDFNSCTTDTTGANASNLITWPGDSGQIASVSGTVSTLEDLFCVARSTLRPTEGSEFLRSNTGFEPPEGPQQQASVDSYDYSCLKLHMPPCVEASSLLTGFPDAWLIAQDSSAGTKGPSSHEPETDSNAESGSPLALTSPSRNVEPADTHGTAPTNPVQLSNSDNAPVHAPLETTRWIHYKPRKNKRSSETPGPGLTAGGTRKRGRKGPLDEAKRRKANETRITRACWNCRWRRKSVSRFLATRVAEWTGAPFSVDLTWGFGPTFPCTVRRVVPRDEDAVCAAEWWYVAEERAYRTEKVLAPPIAFAGFDPGGMCGVFDGYLGKVVDVHFAGFPLFVFGPATFRGGVLQLVYKMYEDQERPALVRLALKLLLLVYILNHVIRVDQQSEVVQRCHQLFPEYQKLPAATIGSAYHTPRLANIQIKMALSTMVGPMVKNLLRGLQAYICRRRRTEWTIAVSVLVTLALILEELQVQIHLSIMPGDTPSVGAYTKNQAHQICNTMTHGGMDVLLDLYTAGFGTWIAEFGNGPLEKERVENIDPVDLSTMKFIGGLKFLSGELDIDAKRMYQIDEPGVLEAVFPVDAEGVSDFFNKVAGRLFLGLFKG
ncbi:hypothetical protein FGG08_000475 [Glutinoglossum americanum]|uniref:Uncharacterized protein n=1 Tax=Glutinoglossum americanum TaxID=1670608 RepID=A0A9P8L628_9PEZI|nr:hypothetical protein FGG08_000475 [Glutinoglossum americanum]